LAYLGPRHYAVISDILLNVLLAVGDRRIVSTTRHHCQAIQTIIDQLTETKSNTELRLLSQRLQRTEWRSIR
jgi:hypothetical protein